MLLGYLADKGKSKSGARHVGVFDAGQPKEFFKDARHSLSRYSISLISDFNPQSVVASMQFDGYIIPAGAVFDCISDEVCHCLGQQVGIYNHWRDVRGEAANDPHAA